MSIVLLSRLGIEVNGDVYQVRFLSIVGDCPALKLVLNFIGHQGYYCCFFCRIRGEHIPHLHKRQYFYQDDWELRDSKSFAEQAIAASSTGTNVNGHLGVSVLNDLIDTPLPGAIMIDYLHVALLRHAKALFSVLHQRLKPGERKALDEKFRNQPMPHFFHRKLRPLSDLAYAKGTELKNNLFYAVLPFFVDRLPMEMSAHLSLYICAIRLWHSTAVFGGETSRIAAELFSAYYRDHDLFYCGLQNFVLHIHSHLEQQHENFGALSFTSTFAQEDFVGYLGNNRHGSRYHGDLIAHYYSVDFALQSKIDEKIIAAEGLFDQDKDFDVHLFPEIQHQHSKCCSCSSVFDCVRIFRRCRIHQQVYHSSIYSRSRKSNSCFVQYRDEAQLKYGHIELFFSLKDQTYALIHHHPRISAFSDRFKSSTYYSLLKDSVDYFFSVLQREPSSPIECVPINAVETHVIVFESRDYLITTSVINQYEHD